MIRGLSPNATIATTSSSASFDATKFHTLEMVAQGASLTVYTVGIAFGDEANAGKAGGQRAQNLIVAQPGSAH